MFDLLKRAIVVMSVRCDVYDQNVPVLSDVV